MKVDIVAQSDTAGGAARASFRLHKAFLNSALVESEMLVVRKFSDLNSVHCALSKQEIFSNILCNLIEKKIVSFHKTDNPVLHSANFFGSNLLSKINESSAEITNLHWCNHNALSIKQIAKIQKPIVMTLHDMWAFCGGEHYVDNYREHDIIYKRGKISNFNQSFSNKFDLNKSIWNRKRKYWGNDMTIVTPSDWLTQCAAESELFGNSKVFTIPNALDTNLYRPLCKDFSRSIFNIDDNKKIIGFGALGGGTDLRKGFDLLKDALKSIEHKGDYRCVVFGQSKPRVMPDIGLPVEFIGHLNDDITLSLFYNTLDVMVVPSRLEAFGQTASEAQSCGVPVVAFDTTGLKDVVSHGMTGYLAKVFDVKDLACGIEWCTGEDNPQLKLNARKRAVKLWSQDVVTQSYLKVFNQLQ
ncbi:glycosyltransferase [Vibrio sp. CAU 1672]|uniref:glycosyltransferase n=1 Tax=Vibrio sp. CAU 1672 TaxID=3032594 RepID=UPI0023D9D8C2|nr:glycosyltransferase [Vibrio sp. CAU 1672]MDF2155718.1 glycosyltransferase [Vibrio sp. CAU 1672]